MDIGPPSAAHFIYIPFMLLIGVVIGWVLGSRAAQDAFARSSSGASEERAGGLGERQRLSG